MSRLEPRVSKLEVTRATPDFHFHIPVNRNNPTELATVRQLVVSAGKILVVLDSSDDLRL